MQIDRMDLDECRTPEKLISEIMRQVPDMPIPVPIEEVARAVDITEIHRMETPDFEGGLITQPERRDGMILVNAGGTLQRQRYTIGHEIGHYLMVSHQPPSAGGPFICQASDMTIRKADRDDRAARMEMEANRFSAGMLMPLAHFRPDMQASGPPDLAHVFDLATRYDTSFEATAIHYTGYHEEPCAVVVSKDGVVQRIFRPSRFPFIDIVRGRPFPSTSYTARMGNRTSGWGEVDGGTWLADSPHARGTIREQGYRAAQGRIYTLLVAGSRDNAEIDDEEAPEDVFDRFANPRFPGRRR
jgi:Zn-dependent peptidase ImmA (M78 family)